MNADFSAQAELPRSAMSSDSFHEDADLNDNLEDDDDNMNEEFLNTCVLDDALDTVKEYKEKLKNEKFVAALKNASKQNEIYKNLCDKIQVFRNISQGIKQLVREMSNLRQTEEAQKTYLDENPLHNIRGIRLQTFSNGLGLPRTSPGQQQDLFSSIQKLQLVSTVTENTNLAIEIDNLVRNSSYALFEAFDEVSHYEEKLQNEKFVASLKNNLEQHMKYKEIHCKLQASREILNETATLQAEMNNLKETEKSYSYSTPWYKKNDYYSIQSPSYSPTLSVSVLTGESTVAEMMTNMRIEKEAEYMNTRFHDSFRQLDTKNIRTSEAHIPVKMGLEKSEHFLLERNEKNNLKGAFVANIEIENEAKNMEKSLIETKNITCEADIPVKEGLEKSENFLLEHNECSHWCEVCLEKFSNKKSLQQHYKIHTGDKPHRCTECTASFNNIINLQLHKATHSTSEFKCHQCDKIYTRLADLKLHIKVHEENLSCNQREELITQGSHWCDLSLEKFSNNKSLQQHYKIHTDDKPHRCTECTASFHNISNLQLHKAIHSPSMFKCPQCDKIYSGLAYLKLHIKKKHKEDLSCNEQEEEFITQIADSKVENEDLNDKEAVLQIALKQLEDYAKLLNIKDAALQDALEQMNNYKMLSDRSLVVEDNFKDVKKLAEMNNLDTYSTKENTRTPPHCPLHTLGHARPPVHYTTGSGVRYALSSRPPADLTKSYLGQTSSSSDLTESSYLGQTSLPADFATSSYFRQARPQARFPKSSFRQATSSSFEHARSPE